MEVDPKKRPIVLTSFADLAKLKAANDEGTPDPDPVPVTKDTVQKTTTFDAPRPRFGGLHQLAVLDFENATQTPDLDFTKYRAGFNNRNLLGPIADDLNKRFGTHINYGYTQEDLEAYADPGRRGGFGLLAQGGRGFKIGERVIDRLVAPFEYGIATRAIASFCIAHEFFHALLRHPEIDSPGFRTPDGWRIKSYDKYRPLFELQVDYLAARYLRLLGLPIEPVVEMFRTQEFKEGKDYPSGLVRADNVKTALEEEFRTDLFSNDIVDCLDFLESLVIK